MRVGLLKTSLVDFPGRVAAAVFLPGCNLRCPYCHNAALACASVVTGPKIETENDESGDDYFDISEAYAHLEKRAKVLGGLAVSGGEPFLSPALPSLIKKARDLSLAVKIDTNGTLPDRLRSILADPELRPDMIAIDVKTSPERYGELALDPAAGPFLGEALLESLAILSAETVRVEYRTVLAPGLVGEEDIKRIGALLPAGADWKLARFAPGACLDPLWNEQEPYPPTKLDRLVALARSLVPKAELR